MTNTKETSVQLRSLTKQDYQDIQVLMDTNKTHKLFNQSRLFFQKDVFFNYINHLSGEDTYFVIESKKLKSFIGLIGLVEEDAYHAELMIVLNPKFYGQGYSDQALSIIFDYAFHEKGYTDIFIQVDADNTRALNFFKRTKGLEESPCEKGMVCLHMRSGVEQT